MDPKRLIFAVAVASCGSQQDQPTAATQLPAKPEDPNPRPDEPPAAAALSPSDALLEWLDPQAVAVAYSNLPPEIDTNALSVVFALPPKVEQVLRQGSGILEDLEAVTPPDAPPPSEWFDPRGLVAIPLVASGGYVLRYLSKPRKAFEAMLTGAGMRATQVEGITMLQADGPFPYRIALLSDAVAAFIPVKEVGSGLSPLTAGRDLPASMIETQVRKILGEQPSILLELHAAGPMLHYDLDQDIAQVALRAIPFRKTGLDVELRMVPTGDATAAATALQRRSVEFESDQIKAMAGRVAFTVEGQSVVGRLQITPSQMANLKRAY